MIAIEAVSGNIVDGYRALRVNHFSDSQFITYIYGVE
jgi:hypothetical protein